MKKLYQYFFRGLITILPIGLTVYLLYAFWTWSEVLFKSWLRPLVGDAYLPGMGLVVVLLAIILLGYLISHRVILGLVSLVEFPFANIPVVKSIYLSLKNFADYFNPSQDTPSQQAVVVKSPNHDLEVVGLVTVQNSDTLPKGFSPKARVAVFLPMGYNVGGYTIFVPTDWITPIEMSAEEVMRNSLFAWMTNSKEQDA